MSNQQKSVLIIGLKYGGPNSPYNPEQIATLIEGEVEKLRAAGWIAETVLVEDPKAYDLDAFKQQLNKQQAWSAVCIGYGLRGAPPMSPLFEQVVNTIIENTAPVPKFAFSTAPNGVIECMTRVLGSL